MRAVVSKITGGRSKPRILEVPRRHRSAAFRPCHYPHLFRTHISTSTWYSKTPGKPRELGLPPSTDGVHALSAKSCATARRSRAADHRFVKRSGIMTYIISLTQQTLQKMWVMTRPSGGRDVRRRGVSGLSVALGQSRVLQPEGCAPMPVGLCRCLVVQTTCARSKAQRTAQNLTSSRWRLVKLHEWV